MFTYISNGTGTDAARSSSTSSLTLQQHLTHHYRVLAAAQPTVDTGQRRQRKQRRQDGRRQWRRGADSAETPSTTESADDRRLVEAIIRDDRLPPQYYCRRQQELDSSPPEENSPLREPSDGRSPATPNTILGKIDSYLNRVHASKDDKRVKAGGAVQHGQAAPPSRAPPRAAGRPCPSQHKPPPAVPVRSLVSRKRKLLTGDVIERFPQDFTTKRPFRPQVLRTSASPRLRYMRVYRGPVVVPRSSGSRPRGQRQSHSLGSSSASAASGSSGGQSVRHSQDRSGGQSVRHSQDRSDQQESGEDYQEDTGDEYTSGEDGEEEEEENKEEDEEEAYENDFEEEEEGDVEQEESSGGVSSRVPPLSISPDSDQEAWLREQASKAVTRQRAAHVVKTNYRSPSKDSAYNGGFSSCSRGPTPEETAGHRPAARGPPRVRPTVAPPAPPPAARPAQRFADEQAYVQFLNDVTSDILARGVFTNRILKRVMAAHVDKHRGKLDTTRMRTELERLRLQLGIPDDDALDDAEHGFGCRGGGDGGGSGGFSDGGGANGPASAQTTSRPTPPSPLVLDHHPPPFVDSLLFPTGESWERRRAGAGSVGRTALGAPSGGLAAAPPGGRQTALEGGDPPESMAALLASLSLDESVTQTILSCCQKQTDSRQTNSSVTSEELRECLNWRTPHTDVK